MTEILIIVGAAIVVILLTIIGILSRYKKCPSDKILVVYGKTSGNTPSKIHHGGGTFIWPVIQDYTFMSLNPIQLQVEVSGVSSQMIKVTIPVTLTTAIATEPEVMQNAANRFLSATPPEVEKQIKEILIGEMRSLMATMTIEDINSDREAFIGAAKRNIETELNKVGYKIININTSDIDDDANYIKNLGKKAATQARATAEADIAEQEKIGSIKIAETEKEKSIAIAEASRVKATTVAKTKQTEAITVADINRDREIALAKAEREQLSGVAAEQALKVSEVSKSKAEADAAQAQYESEAQAKIAIATASAEAAEEEAEAKKQIRIASAFQEQRAETARATQEADAKAAEYESLQKQRKAEADKKAGVAEQMTTIEVSEAKAKAEKAKADADKVAGVAKVEAVMATEKTKQERQIEVNEAAAKAAETKLRAEVIVPTEKAKEKAILEAEAKKAQITIAAEAEAEAIQKKADAESQKIAKITTAEAEGHKKYLLADAEGKRASLMAEADKITAVELAPALAVERMVQAGMTPQMIVQYKTVDQLKGIAEASAEMFEHLHLGQVTVYGNENTAGNFMAKTAESLNPALELLKNIPFKKTFTEMFGKEKREELPSAEVVDDSKESENKFPSVE